MWISLQLGRREQEFKIIPKWKKYWKLIQKKDALVENKEKLDWERKFLHRLMLKFINLLNTIKENGMWKNNYFIDVLLLYLLYRYILSVCIFQSRLDRIGCGTVRGS